MRPLLLTVVVSVAAFATTSCIPPNREPPTVEHDVSGSVTAAERDEEDTDHPVTLHPSFSIDDEALAAMTDDLPRAVSTAINAAPRQFLEGITALLEVEPVVLALVDKEHALPAEYVPDDLVPLSDHGERLTLNKEDLALRAVILPDLFAMVDAAADEGIVLDISSSYRSYRYQERLFRYWVDQLGMAEAERVSARAGTSQHQLGTTVDFGSVTPAFADVPAGRWLAENAWRYGFSLSYPDGLEPITGYSYEPWHFRWITRAGTRLERDFFGGVQQYMLEFLAQHGETLRTAYTGDR